MSSDTSIKHERPLSPHLQVYRLPMTALMSILHRATGAALAVGTILVFAVLVAAAMGQQEYSTVMYCVRSVVGQVFLLGWSFSLMYHMFNGIRHLFWDMGYLFELEKTRISGYIVLLFSLASTALIWAL